MPIHVKRIRSRDEDLLRQTGFDPSSSGSGFANLLLLIAQLYNQPGSRLHARLALEFWRPTGEHGGAAAVGLMPSSNELLTGRSPGPMSPPHVATGSRAAELEDMRQVRVY